MDAITRQIIESAALGNINAFEVIYKECSGFVYNTAYRFTGNRPDAEDITQEVFIKLHKSLKTFDLDISFRSWVYRITINTAINHYNKAKALREREACAGAAADQHCRAEGFIEAEHQEKQVQEMIAVLNAPQRACVLLRSVEGLSYREIANALSININTVRSRLKRARKTLICYYAKGGGK